MLCSAALDDCDFGPCCLSKSQTQVREASGRAGLHAPGLASPHTNAGLPLPGLLRELQRELDRCSQSSSEQEQSG